MPSGRLPAWERLLLALATGLTVVIAVAAPAAGYRYYDLLDDPFTRTGIATACAILALGSAAVATVWHMRRAA
jgi:hypothetical protein